MKKTIISFFMASICFATSLGLVACGEKRKEVVFEYQLIGKVFEQGPASEGVPGEQIVSVEIDTGEVQVNKDKVTESSFLLMQRSKIHAIKNVEVSGNKIILTINQSFSSDGVSATKYKAGTTLLDKGKTELDIDNINLYIDEGIDGYDIDLRAKEQKYYNPWIDDFSYTSPVFQCSVIEGNSLLEMFAPDLEKIDVSYNLYMPDGKGDVKAPLILWLPSASEIASDREPRANFPVGNLLLPENQEIFGENGCYVMTANYLSAINAITATLVSGEIIDCLEQSMAHVVDTFNIDTNRIYVMGGSLGGTFTAGTLAWMDSDIFAGAIAAASGFTFGNDGAKTIADRNVPIWFLHSQTDAIGPAGGSVQAKNAVVANGGSAYVTIFSTAYRDGITENGHCTWLYILRNFVGNEEEVLENGTAKYKDDAGVEQNINFKSDTPMNLGYNNILSWLAAQKKNK